jgi:hypothetical protein
MTMRTAGNLFLLALIGLSVVVIGAGIVWTIATILTTVMRALPHA